MWYAVVAVVTFLGGLCAGLLIRKRRPEGVSPTPSELSELVDIVQISTRLGKRKEDIVNEIDEMLKREP